MRLHCNGKAKLYLTEQTAFCYEQIALKKIEISTVTKCAAGGASGITSLHVPNV